ncbi:MAG: glycosyltransferase [Patescibacteria group bacterium]|jgi:glycosyltransferase involved in cell wall biosynthesis
MKICLISNLYKPYNRGGAERIVDLMASDYASQGHEVFIVSTRPWFKKQTAYGARNNSESGQSKNAPRVFFIPGLYFNLARLPLILRVPWHLIDMFDAVSCFRVRKILKKEKPDLVITHNLKGISYLVPRLLKNLGIKHTHYLHDIQLVFPSGILYYGEEKKLDSLSARIYQRLLIRLFNSPETVLSPSKWLLDLHTWRGFFKDSKKEARDNSVLINALNSGPPETKDGTGKEFKFLFAGQIEKQKGIEVLIKAFFGLAGACLTIAGDGGLMEKIKQESGNGGRIFVLGKKSPKEVLRLMAQSDCLVVPSLCYENSPSVIYEAIAQKLPIIASNIGGIPELIKKYGGKLFIPGSAEDLKKKMEEAIDEARRKVV